MQPARGVGGKAACRKQRELRQQCLEDSVYEIDLTEAWPQWREVLRALSPNIRHAIIGPGIAAVKFRLLQGVRDPNYFRVDSGERHVFEIVRVDTSAVHLHYHKNCKFEDPLFLEPIVTPQHANSDASQPTAPVIAPTPSQPIIGRREAGVALARILNASWNKRAGAVDITDAQAFDWKRFLTNTMEHREVAAMQLERVFAVRTADSGPVSLAFCTSGPEWTTLDPNQKTYTNTRLPDLHETAGDWRTNPLFLAPRTADRNWMRMR